MDLAEEFLKKLNDINLSEDYTVDDFYEEMGIPKENRSDFATAAILKQAWEKQSAKDLPPINPVLLHNVEKGNNTIKGMAKSLKRLNKWRCQIFTKSVKKRG
jgi:hypothetical protein